MNQKEKIIKEYKKSKVTTIFDRERSKYKYQWYKHDVETSVVSNAIYRVLGKAKVLDVACGTCRMGYSIKDMNKEVEYIGVDSSQQMLDMVYNKDFKTVIGDAEKLPFKDNTFDVTFTLHLLWHLPYKNQQKIVKEMFRVTKDGGYVVFDTLNKDFVWKKGRKVEGLYKINLKQVKELIDDRPNINVRKLNDAHIRNGILYSIFNQINEWQEWFKSKYYHMLFYTVRKCRYT